MNYIDEFIENISKSKYQLVEFMEFHRENGEPKEALEAALQEYEASERKFVAYITEFLMTMQASRMPRRLVLKTVAYYQEHNRHGKRMLEIWKAFNDGVAS